MVKDSFDIGGSGMSEVKREREETESDTMKSLVSYRIVFMMFVIALGPSALHNYFFA